MKQNFEKCLQWYCHKKVSTADSAVCQTRDRLQGRLDHTYQSLATQTKNGPEISLLTAVAGEIGNNCFDHNLGQWQDSPGCWYEFGFEKQLIWVVIADRGQGILASLKRALPSLKTDQEALETAFRKRLSGRSPEQRGNGLKFVRNVINGNSRRSLLFISGNGFVTFGELKPKTFEDMSCLMKASKGQGTFALVLWEW